LFARRVASARFSPSADPQPPAQQPARERARLDNLPVEILFRIFSHLDKIADRFSLKVAGSPRIAAALRTFRHPLPTLAVYAHTLRKQSGYSVPKTHKGWIPQHTDLNIAARCGMDGYLLRLIDALKGTGYQGVPLMLFISENTLCCAASSGQMSTAKLIFEIAACAWRHQGLHTLFTAVMAGRSEMARFVIENGLKDVWEDTSELGLVACDLKARKVGKSDAVAEEALEVALIAGLGADACRQLKEAAKSGNARAIQSIIRSWDGQPVPGFLETLRLLASWTQRPRSSLMDFACGQNCLAVINILLDRDSSLIHSRNGLGETPLQVAVRDRCMETVTCLLERGADPRDLGGEWPPIDVPTLLITDH
jgi:hypothetical protein